LGAVSGSKRSGKRPGVACLERRQESMARKWGVAVAVAVFVAAMGLAVVHAGPPAGAIFTTVWNGSEVNYNIYPSKDAVYLDGGPGPGAPQWAAGLDDGIYVFQVTDPSGKVLLSTDLAECRQFQVADGIITNVVGTCPHNTGNDVDHPPAITVQLIPFNDTPNPGGEYKVWVTQVDDFLRGCEALGVSNGLEVVDCGLKSRGNAHGFIPKYSKTDNFKVRGTPKEIDTRFHDGGLWGPILDGRQITWTDPLGGSNIKWSYLNRALDINHEAHVEAVEYGTHYITIANQANCMIGAIAVDYKVLPKQGPQTVAVTIKSTWQGDTIFIDVACK
jgi:hypothetical protein